MRNRLGIGISFFFLFSKLALALDPVVIDSHEAAVALAEKIILSIKEHGETKNSYIELTQIKGPDVNPHMKTVVALLEDEGIEIRGFTLSEAQYNAEKEKFLDNALPSEDELDRIFIEHERHGQKTTHPFKKSWKERLSPINAAKKLGSFAKRFFGLPKGFAVLKHIVKKNPETSKLERKYTTDHKLKAVSAFAAVVAASSISLGSIYGKGMSPEETLLPALILASWVGAFSYYRNEIAHTTLQGKTVLANNSEKEGRQIEVKSNQPTFYASNFVLSLAINTLMTFALFDWPTLSMDHAEQAIENSLFSVISKGPIEYGISKLFKKRQEIIEHNKMIDAEALTHPDVLKKKKSTAWVTFLAYGTWTAWGLVYGLIKNIHLLSTGGMEFLGQTYEWVNMSFRASELPFVAIATVGSIWQLWLRRTSLKRFFINFYHRVFRKPVSACETLFRVMKKPALDTSAQ